MPETTERGEIALKINHPERGAFGLRLLFPRDHGMYAVDALNSLNLETRPSVVNAIAAAMASEGALPEDFPVEEIVGEDAADEQRAQAAAARAAHEGPEQTTNFSMDLERQDLPGVQVSVDVEMTYPTGEGLSMIGALDTFRTRSGDVIVDLLQRGDVSVAQAYVAAGN